MAAIVDETNSFIPNYPCNNGIKQLKTIQEMLPETCIFYAIARNQILATGSKCSKKTILGFFLPFVICLNGFYLASLFKSPWWPVGTFCAQDLLRGTILSRAIFVLLNKEVFSGSSCPCLNTIHMVWVGPGNSFSILEKIFCQKRLENFCSLRKIASLAVFDDFTSVVKH